ncbi:disease resistance protein RLM3-like [Quercus lobata]|uniref:disease resistance protein RLM3-like n=1 Tax=Quercus lobata TaxID=97700 RepID=UPI001245B865|nr:disease resistance protein RLM3-like [Quercus lobata]
MAATTTLSKPFSSSSSSSSYQPSDDYRYDVFLSFRGEDTSMSFTDHLYYALTKAGFRTFIDNFRRTEDYSSEIFPIIQEFRIFLIVLSKNYASSTGCLEELVEILQCCRRSNQMVVPIFYHVSSSDVRNQFEEEYPSGGELSLKLLIFPG